MGSAMDEKALTTSISQFLKKEDERLSKMNSEMAQLTLERKSLLNDVQELKAMVYQYFNIPIPTHKVAKEVSIMASELSDQHKGIRCEQPAVNENSLCSAHQVFDETPKSENTIENDGTESMEQEESNRDEPMIVDELPHQAAPQVLDGMPEFTDEVDLEIARVSSTEERHDLEAVGDDVREQVVWALGNIAGDSPQCRDLARQSGLIEEVSLVALEQDLAAPSQDQAAHQVLDEMPKSIVDELDLKITPESLVEELNDMKDFKVSDLNHVTSLSLVESVAADLVRFLRKPPDQEEIVMGYIGLLCFDPGGGSLPLIDNSLGLERGGRDLLVTDSLKFELPLQEKCGLWCIDEMLPEMTNAFQISLFGVPVHNPFNLESDQDKENIGLQNLVLETDMFGSVACFETFCFDPGGNSAGVLLIVDYELSEFVAWKLVEMEPENSAHYVVLSNLYVEMGRWADVSKVRGLMKERALMKAFEMYAGKSLLQSEHMTEIRFFAKNPSPQASKGDEMLKGIFLEVKKKFETAMGIIRREKITIDPNDPAAVQQWKGFITRTIFLLILEDKDRLKEGVLLQEL